MAVLEKMGIFGWKEEEENLLLASILTGYPLLSTPFPSCIQ